VVNKSSISILKKRSEFESLRVKGRTLATTNWMVAKILPNRDFQVRVGITLPTYVGTAVMRNKFRRWIKEFIRKKNASQISGVDINFIFKKQDKIFYEKLTHKELDHALEFVFAKLKKIN
jgi:ribonuclease P protein component